MSLKDTKLEAQKILQDEKGKLFFAGLLSFVFSSLSLACAVFTFSMLFLLRGWAASQDRRLAAALYPLFGLASVFSLFFFCTAGCNKKRWFLENALRPIGLPEWFRREGTGFRLRCFALFLLKRAAVFFIFLCFELPCLLCLFGLWHGLSHGGVYESALWLTLGLAAALFITGLCFTGLVCQKYELAEALLFCSEKMTARGALRRSKTLTDGLLVQIWRYKLSFSLWALSCLLLLPAGFSAAYINQAYGALRRFLLGGEVGEALSPAPIVFTKPLKLRPEKG